MNAPCHDGLYQRAHVFFFDRALVLLVAATRVPKAHGLVLKVAFTALVADRTIEWVIDEKKLHHPFPALPRHFGISEDFHVITGR